MTLVDLRPGLRAYVLGAGAVSAIAAGRMYPVTAPQGVTLPHIVYHRISGQGDHHMQGPSGLSRPRMQIDCWALSSDTAWTLALAVKERIDGFKGTISFGSNSPQDSVVVQGIFFDSDGEDYDSDTKLYRVMHDYLVWFEER